MKPLRLQTDDGDYTIDPDLDPAGYKALLGQSAVHRTRLDREAADADSPASMATQIERGRSDAAGDPRYGGYASQWAPFFESLNVIGDNAGKRVTAGVRGLGLPGTEHPSGSAVDMPTVQMPTVSMPRVQMPAPVDVPRVRMGRDAMASLQGADVGRSAADYPSEAEIDRLRVGSSLDPAATKSGGVPPYRPTPNYYASLDSLMKRGR